MSKLFEPFKINTLEIKNRFVRSATVDNLGRDKTVSDAQLAFYREMVLGEVGLIISSGLFSLPERMDSARATWYSR
jgi:2,4-dienoyl-CoA reductase-like NADH-dependent reductase (Old Yellow Enzyme family)